MRPQQNEATMAKQAKPEPQPSPTDKVEYLVGGVVFVLIMINWLVTIAHG
jgi:hypothetical protein